MQNVREHGEFMAKTAVVGGLAASCTTCTYQLFKSGSFFPKYVAMMGVKAGLSILLFLNINYSMQTVNQKNYLLNQLVSGTISAAIFSRAAKLPAVATILAVDSVAASIYWSPVLKKLAVEAFNDNTMSRNEKIAELNMKISSLKRNIQDLRS